MNLYILSLNQSVLDDMPFGRIHNFIINADSEQIARKLASEYCDNDDKVLWLDKNKSNCKMLLTELENKIIFEFGWPDA